MIAFVRDMTDEEKLNLRAMGCIFCMQPLMWLGPQGGLSFNIYCTDCHAGFNVTHALLPWQVIAMPGEKDIDALRPIVDGKMDVKHFFGELDAAIERSVRHAFHQLKRH